MNRSSQALASTHPDAMPLDFESVYAECFDMVWRYVSFRVPQAMQDDVVQEIFLVVHQRLASFEGRSSVRAWVAGVARNVVRDQLGRVAHRSLGGPLTVEPAADDDPAGQLDRRRAAVVVEEALSKMSDEQRDAFLLMEVEELSSREASEVLGVNDSTLRARLRSARDVLASAIGRFRAREGRRGEGGDHGR
ncbi:MAG: RNA polymerase sigma factor [Sandaracinus sp.]|nr:RNA polymerase sigma factor [Sandaracinus sp.]MCB9620032.1 RNA polymerase sigma factor [Sandaracinus sp.]MCB9631932.1 RNA polymerase sigma factor [Sandaracinus sp.]